MQKLVVTACVMTSWQVSLLLCSMYRLGVLVELNCETDFVARGDKFKELVSDMAMQIAASGDITVVSVDDVPADVKQKEFDVEMGKEDIQSKPEQIR